MSNDPNPQGQPGESLPTQGQPADGIQVQQTADGSIALAFVQSEPQAPDEQQQERFRSDNAPKVRLTDLSPKDASLIEYVKAHNAQNPGSPIDLVQASKEIRFAQQEKAAAPQPPVDFNGRLGQVQQSMQATEAALAEASAAGDHARVAELTRGLTTLEVDAREIQRDAMQWQANEATRAQEAKLAELSSVQSSEFERLSLQLPDLNNPASPMAQAFNAAWDAAAKNGDPVLNSPRASSLILHDVLAQMRPTQQGPTNPALRGGYAPQYPSAVGYPSMQPQVPMYPITPQGAPYGGATRPAPSAMTPERAVTFLREEATDAQLDAALRGMQ